MINFNNYFQNITLQLLLFLLVFYFIVKKIKKSQTDFEYISSLNSEEFLSNLIRLKISNPFYEIFICFIYIFSTSLMFLFWRFNSLGTTTEIYLLIQKSISFPVVIQMVTFLLSIIYYFKILNLLFYKSLIKMHLYLYKYKWYIKFTPISYNVISYTKIYIYIMYFICWTYILIESYHKVSCWPVTLKVLELLVSYIPMVDPFSGI